MGPGTKRGDAPVTAGRSRLRSTIAAAVGFALIVGLLGWPLPAQPGSALVDPAALGDDGPLWTRSDVDLLVWILAWDAHALRTQPLAPFQANIFHPAPDALASSEHLLGLLPVAGPLFWSSQNAVLTYNLTTLFVVWLCAFTTFLLARAWSGWASAGFLAGCLFALGDAIPLSFLRLHTSAVHFYPLVLLLAWRAAARPRATTLVGLSLATALQALAGIYVAFGLAALLVTITPFLLARARRHGHRGGAPLAAIGIGLLPLAWIAGPYLRVRAAGLLPDDADALALVQMASESPSVLAGRLRAELTVPGLLLAALGLLRRRTTPGVRGCLVAITAVGGLLALGSGARLPGSGLPSPYEVLMNTIPGFSSMRAPGRFLYLTQLALALLAGLGGASLIEVGAERSRETGRRAASVALCLLALASVPRRTWRGPLPLLSDPLAPIFVGSHGWLRDQGRPGPVLDLPARTSVMDGRGLISTGRAMLGSTLHWYPLLNGYSGHPPASLGLVMSLARRLPERAALDDLCDLTGLRWIVVHHGILPPGSEAAWEAAASTLPITLATRRGQDAIYEVECATPGAATASLLAPAPLAPSNGRFRWNPAPIAPTAAAGSLLRTWVEVTNTGRETWPGRRPLAPGTIASRARWLRPGTADVIAESPPVPLPRDLAPGQRMALLVETMVPAPGDYHLVLDVGPTGHGAFLREEPAYRSVRVEAAAPAR